MNCRLQCWFGRAMWLGILLDWVLGVPAMIDPQWTLRVLGQSPAGGPDEIWAAFAGLLVVLLSLFYIPGAVAPYRYRGCAYLSVASRALGAAFFLCLYRGSYPIFGYLDLVLFLIQAPLLIGAMRAAPSPDERLYN